MPQVGPIGATLVPHWCHTGATLVDIGSTLVDIGSTLVDIGSTLDTTGHHWTPLDKTSILDREREPILEKVSKSAKIGVFLEMSKSGVFDMSKSGVFW